MIGRNVTVAAALTLLSLLPASAKTYNAERYSVQLDLDSRGALHVNETAVFHFANGPFTYVFRDISDRNTDGISNIAATLDGRPCDRGTEPGQVEINGNHVRWHFAPVENQTHTFQLSYVADGVIRKSIGAATLLWHALPPQRSYEIDHAEVNLRYPAGVGAPALTTDHSDQVNQSDGQSSVVVEHVRPRRNLVVTASFAPDSFPEAASRWMQTQAQHRSAFVSGLRYGAAPALLLLLGVIWWMSRTTATWPPFRSTLQPDYKPVPPDNLPPALAGHLTGHPSSAQAVLLDLARRGVISVKESKPGAFGRHFDLTLSCTLDSLAAHEATLIDATFRGERNITLQSFQRRAGAGQRRFGKAVRGALVASGFYDPARLQAKSRLTTAGVLSFAGALLAMPVAAVMYQAVAIGSGVLSVMAIAAAISGVLLLVAGAQFSRVTERGADEATRWNAFAHQLREIAKGRAALPSSKEWDALLPYAAAMQLVATLIRRARKEESLVMPAWFGPWPSGDHGNDGGAFVSFLSTSGATSGGDGGAGAAAASGGGASGAG